MGRIFRIPFLGRELPDQLSPTCPHCCCHRGRFGAYGFELRGGARGVVVPYAFWAQLPAMTWRNAVPACPQLVWKRLGCCTHEVDEAPGPYLFSLIIAQTRIAIDLRWHLHQV